MAANCARKDRLGLTALHEAAQNGQNEAAQLLLTRGRAPSNARDAAGRGNGSTHVQCNVMMIHVFAILK